MSECPERWKIEDPPTTISELKSRLPGYTVRDGDLQQSFPNAMGWRPCGHWVDAYNDVKRVKINAESKPKAIAAAWAAVQSIEGEH